MSTRHDDAGWTKRWFNPDDARASSAEIGTAFADTIPNGLEVPAKTSRRRTA